MSHYLVQASYTAETWGRLIKAPQDREAVVRQVMESVGCKLEAFYFAFGQDDAIAVYEAPDNTTAAALALAIIGSGAFSNFRTTPLITSQEATAAMRRAGQVSYRPPGA